jgi:hypothetical protein
VQLAWHREGDAADPQFAGLLRGAFAEGECTRGGSANLGWPDARAPTKVGIYQATPTRWVTP